MTLRHLLESHNGSVIPKFPPTLLIAMFGLNLFFKKLMTFLCFLFSKSNE